MRSDESAPLLRTTMAGGQAVFGGWCVIPSAFSAEVLAQRGFDWVALDWQHGFIDLEKSSSMIQAISVGGAAPLIRITANEQWIVMKALDLGVAGVIVPLVNNRAEAESAVAACRYPPAGVRSYGPLRSAPAIGTDAAFAGDRVLCFVMVETRDGYENIEAIAQTPGLDGVFIGPDDLRLSTVGPDGKLDDGVVEHILHTCTANNVFCGLHTANGDEARTAAERGFRLVAIGSDADFLANGGADAVRRAHGGSAPEREPSFDRVVQSVVWSGL
jgi:4-hydroxy-2-oxoheptanedioate aldolase